MLRTLPNLQKRPTSSPSSKAARKLLQSPLRNSAILAVLYSTCSYIQYEHTLIFFLVVITFFFSKYTHDEYGNSQNPSKNLKQLFRKNKCSNFKLENFVLLIWYSHSSFLDILMYFEEKKNIYNFYTMSPRSAIIRAHCTFYMIRTDLSLLTEYQIRYT